MSTDTREQIAEEIGRVTGRVGPHERAAADRILALRSPVERGADWMWRELGAARDMLSDNYWLWQGDGEDHLESLICPVVIRPEVLAQLIASPPAPVEGERERAIEEAARELDDYAGSIDELPRDAGVVRECASMVRALAAPSEPAKHADQVGTSSDQVDTRAAITRLYLAAHRAGVEAAAEVLSGTTKGWRTLVAARDTLAEDARADTEDEYNWTDPRSPLAQALAALPVQGEREERDAVIRFAEAWAEKWERVAAGHSTDGEGNVGWRDCFLYCAENLRSNAETLREERPS